MGGSTAAMDDGARTMGEHQHCGWAMILGTIPDTALQASSY